MTCTCIAEMDTRLKPHNARIASGVSISSDLSKLSASYFVQTEKLDSSVRGKKLPLVVMTHCPFCGTKFGEPHDQD